jgi:hypothetical protein
LLALHLIPTSYETPSILLLFEIAFAPKIPDSPICQFAILPFVAVIVPITARPFLFTSKIFLLASVCVIVNPCLVKSHLKPSPVRDIADAETPAVSTIN